MRQTTGAALVDGLLAHGVDTIFGLPGAQTYALYDALAKAGEHIRHITVRHEQAAAYMAFGYARSTGRVGVYTVVPGPGVLNTMAALCTAVGCNVPVICLTAQIPSDFLGKGRGHLHELPDQLATLRSLLKWAERIEAPEEAPGLLAEAFRQAQSGRPGPVALEVPWDVLGREGEVTPVPPVEITPADAAPDAIKAAADLIATAERPMIYVGGGALDAADEVKALAERLCAPVFAFRSGRGVVADDHALGFSLPAAHELWPETDLLIGIGTRLEGPYMRWNRMQWMDRPPEPKLVRIDVDPEEMNRFSPDVGVVADARLGTAALNAALAERGVNFPDRAGTLAEVKARTRDALETVQPQVGFLNAIRAALPRDGFFVEELTQVGFASNVAFPVFEPRTYVTCGYQGTLGFGFPTALGVQAANPDRAVVSVTGDGGFLFAVQELATAAQFGLSVVVVVFDNGGFGNVRRDQETLFEGRVIGANLQNPDFAALARAFGVAAWQCEDADGLGAALEEALDGNTPALIEVRVEPGSEATPWPFIHPPA